MKKFKYSKGPEHGLQIEETLVAGDMEGAKSLARYWWAWSIITAMERINGPLSSVADLGCGCGYGLRILSEDHAGTRFVGVDADREALNTARRDYGMSSNLVFGEVQLSDLWHEPITDYQYTVVTCFDTLEQNKHRDTLLEQTVNHMVPGGVALFSGDLDRMITDPNPKDAFIRYSSDMFLSLLRRYFKTVIEFEGSSVANPVFNFIVEAE